MMTITHLVTSSLAVGLGLGTTQPEILLLGAIAGLLPDIDISTSPIGRILTPISTFLEKRMAHRSATHSLIASGILGVMSYGLAFKFGLPINYVHALNIGFFAGWFLDVFTKSGVEMFYPLPVRCVCPGNRNLRISTASPQEYWLIVFLVAILIWIFNINSNGGLIAEFNRLIAAPSGLLELYNDKGGNHEIIAEVEGVYAGDRSPVKKSFRVLGVVDNDFIVQDDTGELQKAGNDPDSTIITKRINGKSGETVKTSVENVSFLDDDINLLLPYANKEAYLIGSLSIDDPSEIIINPHPKQYQSVALSGNTITFSYTPIIEAVTLLQNQIITGSLSIKIYVQ